MEIHGSGVLPHQQLVCQTYGLWKLFVPSLFDLQYKPRTPSGIIRQSTPGNAINREMPLMKCTPFMSHDTEVNPLCENPSYFLELKKWCFFFFPGSFPSSFLLDLPGGSAVAEDADGTRRFLATPFGALIELPWFEAIFKVPMAVVGGCCDG